MSLLHPVSAYLVVSYRAFDRSAYYLGLGIYSSREPSRIESIQGIKSRLDIVACEYTGETFAECEERLIPAKEAIELEYRKPRPDVDVRVRMHRAAAYYSLLARQDRAMSVSYVSESYQSQMRALYLLDAANFTRCAEAFSTIAEAFERFYGSVYPGV